jgi:hypothetical protein
MTLLLCLILVGQSMASSVMVYKMVGMDMTNMAAMGNMEMSMKNMDHSSMSTMPMSVMSSDSASTNDDCCTKKCQCFASGCSSISAFSKIMSAEIIVEPPTKIYSNLLLVPAQALTSLYRPPILS